MADVRSVSAAALRAMLLDGQELALIDVREEGVFSESHLLFARSVPLSRLELRMARLVPRRATRIVLVDAAEGLAERAASVLGEAGYSALHILAGGIAAWEAAGFELFSGVNVPSKAFGEFVEHESHTPSISAEELDALMRAGTDMVVLDSRPFDEFFRVSIPTGVNVPGAELVLRVHDIAPKPETLVVVNCAGRTRSIIGAQSLINAGVPNKVVALRNGTMGWSLAGLHARQRQVGPRAGGFAWRPRLGEIGGRKRCRQARYPQRSTRRRSRSCAPTRAAPLTSSTCAIRPNTPPAMWRARFTRRAGNSCRRPTSMPARCTRASCAWTTEQVRAAMTASWLAQMGWREVYVLVAAGEEKGFPENPVLGEAPRDAAIDAAALSDLLARNEATVIDVSLSREYLSAHIPGAWFAIRARLERFIQQEPLRRNIVLTSEDGVLAGLAVPEVRAHTPLAVRYLVGRQRGLARGRLAAHRRRSAHGR